MGRAWAWHGIVFVALEPQRGGRLLAHMPIAVPQAGIVNRQRPIAGPLQAHCIGLPGVTIRAGLLDELDG